MMSTEAEIYAARNPFLSPAFLVTKRSRQSLLLCRTSCIPFYREVPKGVHVVQLQHANSSHKQLHQRTQHEPYIEWQMYGVPFCHKTESDCTTMSVYSSRHCCISKSLSVCLTRWIDWNFLVGLTGRRRRSCFLISLVWRISQILETVKPVV